MPATDLHALIHRVARALPAAAADAPDAELLARFAADRDEAAFAALVRRHGGLVLDVCRSVLGNEADAEDVFQATFLVLARAAASVRRAGSLAAWLYGVARRTALKARTSAARRRGHESARPVPAEVRDPDDLSWRDVRRAVHEALAGLSPAYRDPLVLCHLRGLTQAAAARELGLSRAALQKRLERGLAKLRAALVRRGFSPAVVLAAAVPAAAAPPELVAAAARVAAPGAEIPEPILTLAHGGTTMIPGKFAAFCLLPALVFGAALGGGADVPAPAGGASVGAAAPADEKDRKETPAEQETKWLAGEWTVRHVETGGEALFTKDELAKARVVFKDDTMTFKGVRVLFVDAVKIRLDPSKAPKEIDVTPTDGDEKGRTFEGIYVARKDELRICLRLEGTQLGRPKGYATVSGTTLYTFILEPVEKKPAPPTKPAPQPKTEKQPPASAPPLPPVQKD